MKTLDERLYSLKLREPSRWMQLETVARRRVVHSEQWKLGKARGKNFLIKQADSDLGVLREYLPKVDQTCRETWLCDHDAISPEFIRRELVNRIFTQITVRKGTTHSHLKQLAVRTRASATDLTPALHHFFREIERLKGDLATKYEIEATELAKQMQHSARAVDPIATVAATRPANEVASSVGRREGGVNLTADRWRDFHERFQALAHEELQERAGERNRFLRGYFTYTKGAEILHVQSDARWAFGLFSGALKLPAEPKLTNTGIPAHGPFCLIEIPACGLWVLSDGINENFRERFQAFGTRAGVALGSPKGTDPLDFWLHRLTLDLRANKSALIFAGKKGEDGIIVRLCEASAIFCSRLEREALEDSAMIEYPKIRAADGELTRMQRRDGIEATRPRSVADKRKSFVSPLLDKLGLSIHDWANRAKVDFHTAHDYLRGKTKPRPSTRKKLADSLGIKIAKLPD